MKISLTRARFLILTTVFILASLSGCAADKKRIPEHYTCIPALLFRCEPDEQTCMTIPIDDSLGPVQIHINLTDNRVQSVSEEKLLSESDIFSVEEDHDLIYLNGRGRGIDNTIRAWNAVINRNNGRLYSSTITTGAGHVIYGECHEN